MAQKVIASRDIDIYVTFDDIGLPHQFETGTSLTYSITGTTDDIGAISTDEPIAIDNGGNTYDISLTFQAAEEQTILDALRTATVNREGGPIVHIRQVVEAATFNILYHKRRDVPATTNVETFTNCTGSEKNMTVERRSSETTVTWNFRGRGMAANKVPL